MFVCCEGSTLVPHTGEVGRRMGLNLPGFDVGKQLLSCPRPLNNTLQQGQGCGPHCCAALALQLALEGLLRLSEPLHFLFVP